MSHGRGNSAVGLSVVIPVFNEEDCLPELIRRCIDACRTTEKTFEIILTDDGSEDASRDIIRRAATDHPEVVGVLLNRNYGQHPAVMAGLAQSRGAVVVTLDADLQNPPEEISRLVAETDRGADVVGTIRVPRHDSLFRRFFSYLLNRTVQKVTGVMMHDYGCMLRAYRRPIVNAMLQCHEQSTFIPTLANSFARATAEIEVSHAPRSGGRSRYTLWKLVNLHFDLLTSMTAFPLRILSLLGALISLLGVGFGALLLIMRLLFGATWAVQGVFTLFAVLFVFVGLQFVGMGLLGEYLSRVYDGVRARPQYFVEEVVGGGKGSETP